MTGKSFTFTTCFCDEDGNKTDVIQPMHWKVDFKKSDTGSLVEAEISFPTEDAMNTIIGMGFEEGFSMGLGNLDELLAD